MWRRDEGEGPGGGGGGAPGDADRHGGVRFGVKGDFRRWRSRPWSCSITEAAAARATGEKSVGWGRFARLPSCMVEFPSIRAFEFRSDLDRIEDAFKASISAMDQAYEAAEAAHDRYVDSGEDDDEYDDDGVLISSTRHQLRWEAMQKSMAQTVIREAFLTSIFHFWEYSARYWMGDQDADFRGLRRKVRALGYAIDCDGLVLLNELNNLLKHDNAKTGAKLFKRAPRLFWMGREPAGPHWRSALRVMNEDVLHFIKVVRNSGPTYP